MARALGLIPLMGLIEDMCEAMRVSSTLGCEGCRVHVDALFPALEVYEQTSVA